MFGLMQEAPLTLDTFLEYAARWHGGREIASRRSHDGAVERATYTQVRSRAKRVSNALLAMGIGRGDRIATLCWNTVRHVEAWFGTIGIGAVLHTLNPRLFEEQLVYMIDQAGDRLLLADPACAPLVERLRARSPRLERIIYLSDAPGEYEEWISAHDETCRWGGFDERSAAGLCYTSGTTGNPKGVLYSHRSNYIHALMTLQADAFALSARDTILLTVPMYHISAWGVVYSAPAVGAKLVLPGHRLDGPSLYELIETEGVTFSAAVPTVWQALLAHLKSTGSQLTTLRRAVIGGSACPESLIRAFHDEYGVDVIHAWGMTETSSLATVSSPTAAIAELPFDRQLGQRGKQGRPLCGLDLKITDDGGNRLPHDGKTSGRLKIKGPTIVGVYFPNTATPPAEGGLLDDEGFFDTGDISTIDPHGYMRITDRAKDIIKSGGEWISSIEIENLAVAHPKAQACAVVARPHAKWGERPVLIVQLKPGESASAEEFRELLQEKIAKWWMPDEILFIAQIPLGATGKIDKKALRELVNKMGP